MIESDKIIDEVVEKEYKEILDLEAGRFGLVANIKRLNLVDNDVATYQIEIFERFRPGYSGTGMGYRPFSNKEYREKVLWDINQELWYEYGNLIVEDLNYSYGAKLEFNFIISEGHLRGLEND